MTIAYWCVLIAALLPYLVTFPAKATKEYDNTDPRGWASRQTGFRHRALGAQSNGFEAFPFFAVAVITAQLQQVQAGLIDQLALLFIAARIAHAAAYYLNLATLRSICWLAGIGSVTALYLSPVWSAG
jgi:uncharacterized MAPEG superfamily protein